MSKQSKQHKPEQQQTGAATETPETSETSEQLDAQAIEEIQSLVQSGQIEVPPGAERIVEAFRATLAQKDDLLNRMKILAAEYQNYQRRAAINEREARTGATCGVVQSVLPVMDHFDLALGQDLSKATAEQIAGGVQMIRAELMRILESYGVSLIEPKPGEQFNPSEQQAMLHQPSEDIEPGHVVSVLGVGYRLGDRVIRPAKVSIAAPASGE
ncbi:MAG: nucleotide exchange factor GrpE [Phycisphaerales bacterium]